MQRNAGHSLRLVVLPVLAALTSCGFNVDNYKRAVKSGFPKIPESLEIEGLFGEADHFISYSGSNVPKDWNTVVYFGGRYTLNMQVDVETNAAFDEITKIVGNPRFVLWGASEVIVHPNGSVETSYSGDWKFRLDDWKKVLAAKGDFSVIGIKIKGDPIPNFDAYVRGERQSRIRVRPD